MSDSVETSAIRFPHIRVRLSGENGNAFVIIGRVSSAIRRAESREAAESFAREAVKQPSYDALLQFVMGTVSTS